MNQPGDKLLPDFTHLIQAIERTDLDCASVLDLTTRVVQHCELAPVLENLNLLRICAVSKSQQSGEAEAHRYLMEDVISGLYGTGISFVYLILGGNSEIGIYLGIPKRLNLMANSASAPEVIIPIVLGALQSTYPDIEILLPEDRGIEKSDYPFTGSVRHCGIMTGIPTPKLGKEKDGGHQIERLLRGLYRQQFAYMVTAVPIEYSEIMKAFNDIAERIREASQFVKPVRQYAQTPRLTVSGESTNRQAQHYVELMEILLDKLKTAKAQGLWRTQSLFFADGLPVYATMSTLLKVVFGGHKSCPEPIRTIDLAGADTLLAATDFRESGVASDGYPLQLAGEHPLQLLTGNKYATILNSRDLATLTHLPEEEMPGYKVKETARFAVHPPAEVDGGTAELGEIVDRGVTTGNSCKFKVDDLTKHGIVAGVTGSGKTNTIFNILHQLHKDLSLPFLVIEPAKGEYRALSRVDGFEDLRIFTLGDETIAPFRLNPFEIMDGVRVQTHIDYLRTVFNASFVMYAPMPYVIERCIHEIYLDKGWDLLTGLNRSRVANDREVETDVFPTLTDLYEKIDSVADRLGYEEKVTMDVKAALKTRIGSLRIGGKGAMLDTPSSISMETLLSKPTILELHSIGDDEEKTFIIGLVLARLYEFRETEKRAGKQDKKLRHVTVIEEAHRLLTRTPPETGNLEVVNIKAKAVESFCNILSEIRAFGEGVLIAEQIPSKLSPDAIKNSNLKIVHRIVAKDDRDLLGTTMNLSEEQNRYLALLKPGLSAVFYEGVDNAFLVAVPYYPDVARIEPHTAGAPTDTEIREFMKTCLSELDSVYCKYKGCSICKSKCHYSDWVKRILEDPEVLRQFSRYMLAVVENESFLGSKYGKFKEAVLSKALSNVSLSSDETTDLMLCLMVTAGNRFLSAKRQQYDIAHPDFVSLRDSYTDVLGTWFATKIKSRLSAETESAARHFKELYIKALHLDAGPFPDCNEFCRRKCLFRFETLPLINSKEMEEGLISAIFFSRGDVREFCFEAAEMVSMGEEALFLENVALCFFIQKSMNRRVRNALDNRATCSYWTTAKGG